MNATQIQPYLFFAGRCEEALEFYQRVLGAKVQMLMRYNESPTPAPEGMLQAGFENKIMHATFQIGSSVLMASDGCNDQGGFQGFKLSLFAATPGDAELAFAALAADGEIEMPLGPTFWSPSFGMLTDRFGVSWMVSVPPQTA